MEDADAHVSSIANRLGIDVGVAKSLYGLFQKIGAMSMSTAYSGIDAPGTSVASLLAYAEADLKISAQHPEHVYAIEWNHHCQHELQMHPRKAQCLFSNLEDFLSPHLRELLPELIETDKLRNVLQQVVLENAKGSVSTLLG